MKKIIGLLFVYILMISPVMANDFRFAQVTDVRYSTADESNNLEKFVENINKDKEVKFVVFTGDNIARSDKEDLKSFLSIAKKLKCPFYIVLGDKDVNKRKGLSKKEYTKLIRRNVFEYRYGNPNFKIDKKNLLFLFVDGSKEVVPNTVGYYKDNVTEWIDANLDLYKKKKVIILQHFPIVPPIEKEMYNTYKADKYLDIINKHQNVKAVVSGHYGINREQIINDVSHISTAPLPQYRIIDILDYEKDDCTIWTEIRNIWN